MNTRVNIHNPSKRWSIPHSTIRTLRKNFNKTKSSTLCSTQITSNSRVFMSFCRAFWGLSLGKSTLLEKTPSLKTRRSIWTKNYLIFIRIQSFYLITSSPTSNSLRWSWKTSITFNISQSIQKSIKLQRENQSDSLTLISNKFSKSLTLWKSDKLIGCNEQVMLIYVLLNLSW